MNPHHLTHDAQAQALAEWGRGGSFRCVACGNDCTDERPALAVPTAFPGFALGACGACARRLRQSAGYRRQTAKNARTAGLRCVLQRVADLIGVDHKVFADAFQGMTTRHEPGPEALRLVDSMLGVPAGSVEGAMKSVLNVGGKQ